MSTQLIPANMAVGAIAHLYAKGSLGSSIEDDVSGDGGVTDHIVRLKVNSDGKFVATLAGEDFELDSDKEIDFTIVAMKKSQTLWPPRLADSEKDVDKQRALCRTNWFSPSDVREAVGVFDHDEAAKYGLADGVGKEVHSCHGCPYNKWGSRQDYEPGYQGQGKACSSRRTLFIIPSLRAGSWADVLAALQQQGHPVEITRAHSRIGVYTNDNEFAIKKNPGVAMLDLSEGSNSRVFSQFEKQHNANMKAVGGDVDLALSVFSGSVEVYKGGDKKYGYLKIQWAGSVAPASISVIEDVVQYLNDIIPRVNERIESEIEELSRTKADDQLVDAAFSEDNPFE